jgi:tetratricopeptide (TPR) repeat protein
MKRLLRKLFGYPQDSPPIDKDADLEKFFTDSEYPLRVFEQQIGETHPSKSILVIHGIGGVGKSTLLKMFVLSCHKRRIPVALVASEETHSSVDVLSGWATDLSHNSVILPTFQKTLNNYHSIGLKVETEAKKARDTRSQIATALGKTTAKTVIGMAASAIPVVGPVVGTLVGESADAFIDWLRGFLSKPELELYLDPTKRLTSDFLDDLSHVAARQDIVLIADTYEQMTALDDCIRDLAQGLPQNVLLVIAGRTVPAWERAWPGWMGRAEIIELQEMTPDDLRSLVHRYYAYIRRGRPDSKQVEAIVQFARGLPLVATTVVQLWVKYGAEDFQTVRPQVVADLVDRLLEGVPQEMRPAFEAAAVLRYFNVDSLSAILQGDDAETLYTELRHWPFIRSYREGLAVHDTMREMINEALHVRTLQRFQILHERAAVYYEARLEKATSDERERYTSERLYHHVCANEGNGVQLFQELAEELTRYRLVNRLRALLKDVNTYPLEQENSRLWVEYYNARLADLELQISRAEEMYQTIAENERIESKLRAYALCDWGGVLSRRERISQPGMEEKAIDALETSLKMGGAIYIKLAMSWLYLNQIYRAKANWEKAFFYLEQAKRFFTEHSDTSGLITVLEYERRTYGRQGNLRKVFDIDKEIQKIYTAAGEPPYLRTRIFPLLERLWAGQYAETEKGLRTALEITKSSQDQEELNSRTRDLVLCLSLQSKCSEALITIARSFSSDGEPNEVFLSLTLYGIACLKCGELDKAEEYLTQAIPIGQNIRVYLDITLLYLAILYEIRKRFDKAEHFYQLLLEEEREFAHNLFKCSALTGLVRVKYAQHDYAAIPPLLTEAEQLAQQYEYNDHLSSLSLTRGHIAWDGLSPQWSSGFDSALQYYQYALIYALRYNRFLLDETLSGREQGTPLEAIIPHCLRRGKEGQQMLMALRDWWQSSNNDTGTPRSESISPITESIPLLEAEHIARNREPGDDSLQKNVVDQINSAQRMANRS